MKALQTWIRLPAHEKLLVIEAWCDLLIVAALLRTPLHRHLTRQRPVTRRSKGLIQPESAIRLVNAAARFHIKKMTCLERALVARRALRRRGIDVTLRIGARRVQGQIEAHAWLEQEGQALDDRANQYSILQEPGA